MPGYSNPQSLNRYSYVTNNPLRYTDPTGHIMVEDEGSTKGGLDCRKFPQYCNNGKKKPDEELRAMSPKLQPKKVVRIPTATVTPINLRVTVPTPTATLPINGTPLPQQCTSGYPCVGNFIPSATPTATPIPHNDNKFPVTSVVPSIFIWPPDFSPNADDIWNIIGNSLPLINQPVVNSNTIVNSIVDGATNAINTASNTLLGYAGYLVSNGISPTIPIVPYAPFTNPLAPVYQ